MPFSIKSKETFKCKDCGYAPTREDGIYMHPDGEFRCGHLQAFTIEIFGYCITCMKNRCEVKT